MIVWISECPFARGGFATVTRNILHGLKNYYRVASVCFGANTVMEFDGYRVYPYAIPVEHTIRRIERDYGEPVTTIVVHGSPWTPPYSDVLLHLQEFRGALTLFGYFVHEAVRLPEDVRQWFKPGGYVDEVITPTRATGKLAGIKNFHVVPHGADASIWVPGENKVHPFTVSMVAANYIRKRWDLFFKTIAMARKDGYDVAGLAWVPLSGTWNIRRLIWATEQEIGSRVIVGLPKPYDADIGVPDEVLAKALSETHAYLHMTLGEAWGLPIGEALLAGLPTAAVNYPAIKEWAGRYIHLIKPCREHVISPDGLIYNLPCLSDAVKWIEHTMDNYDDEVSNLLSMRDKLAEELSWSNAVEKMVEVISKEAGG